MTLEELQQFTKAELIDIGEAEYGFTPGGSKEEIIEQLTAVIEAGADNIPAVTQPAVDTDDAAPDDRITIRIEDVPGEPSDVQVSLNGVAYNIKRGHDVDVPMGVYNVLKDAVVTHYEQDTEGNITTKRANRFPVSRV